MVFAGKVIEKSAFAQVGRFGDIFDCSFRKAFLRKEGKGATKQALANFGAATLAPTG